jgi:hypothetical protein
MRLVNKHSEEQAASDALLSTAQTVKAIGVAAADIISTTTTAQPSRQQLVVTCVGESGVSLYYSSMSIAFGSWPQFT